jgi:hypothetical protein
MALERRDPLPAGRYSIFLLPGDSASWSAWTSRYRSTVRVVATVDKREGFITDTYMGSSIVFTVTAPTPWVGLGLPTIETRPIAEWQAEEMEVPKDETTGPIEQVRNLVIFAGVIYLAGAVLRVMKP